MNYIANGVAEIISEGDNKKILVSGNKSYFKEGGAFWFSTIYDIEGILISLFPPGDKPQPSKCISIKEIIDINNFPHLIQNPEDCILIER